MVKALADSFPSLKTLRCTCEGYKDSGSRSVFFSKCFFAALPLLLPGLTDLGLKCRFGLYFDLRPSIIPHVAGLSGLSTLRLPSMILRQDEVQLLANMPNLRELSVSGMQLSTAIDARMCAWRRLDLIEVADSPAQALVLPLKHGMQLRIHRTISWTLGPATTAAEVAAEARTLAQASELISSCLCDPPPAHLSLMWPSDGEDDHTPRPAAGRTAELMAALAPFATIAWHLSLHLFAVDAAEAQAIASALPCSSSLKFIDCLVTSQAWVQLHGLQCCNYIDIRGYTAINASDVLLFASTVRQGCKLRLERDWREELDDGEEEWFDPIGEARDTILEAMPALFSHRQKTGRPLVEIVFDIGF